MPKLQVTYKSKMSIVCVCVCVKLLKYNLTILELVSTPSYSHSDRSKCPLSRTGPPFKNCGSAPGASVE